MSARRAQLEMIGAPVGGDDEVGREVRPGRLDEHMDAAGRAGAALGVADDPAHGVAGRDGPEPTRLSPGWSAMSVTWPGAARPGRARLR